MPSPTSVLLRTQSDERLVALARAGHERAFEAIVERYRRPLVRACRRVLPEARAEDAVQQALVAAWSALSRGDEVHELRPWLYRIAHNTALNQLRIAGYDYDELHGMLETGAAPEEELERREVARRTLTGLAALPPRQREALLQTAVQGRGQEEVARALGVSEPAVRQLVHRARTQLRAAATALTPFPLAGWLADAGGAAGAAGATATVAKLSAVVVLAGGAAAGPGMVDHLSHGSAAGGSHAPALGAAEAKAAEPKHQQPAQPVATSTPARPALRRVSATPRGTVPAHQPVRSGRSGGERHGDDGGVDGRSGGDDEVRTRSRGGDDGRETPVTDDRSGPGGGDGVSAPEPGDDSHSGSDDAAAGPAPAPAVATPAPTVESQSGSGGGDDHELSGGSLDHSSGD